MKREQKTVPLNKVMRWIRKFLPLDGLLVLTSAVLSLSVCQAQQPAEEYALKAAFLYNFARFTEWPSTSFPQEDFPFIVCIFGDDPFGATIDFLQDKSVHGRPILLKREKSLARLESCHVLFVSASKKNELGQILDLTEGWSVLTVSDMDQFAQKGGGIGFIRQNDKIRFEVNTGTIKRAGLRLSSKLLQLALLVDDPAQQVDSR